MLEERKASRARREETSIYNEIPAGDHTLVLLRLHAVGQGDAEGSPLVFHRSTFGRLAGKE